MQKTATLQAQYEQKMNQAKLRNTHVRQRIFDALCEAQQPITIQELIANTDTAHFVSIYRSIDTLRKADIVKLVPQGFKNLFELGDVFKPHHHHATCEACGATVELQEPELEQLMSKITKDSGLQPTKHHFELFGICAACTATAAK